MEDIQLPRIVAAGIILLTGAALVAGSVLSAKGIANDLTTVVAGGTGALAGFLARGRSSAVTSGA